MRVILSQSYEEYYNMSMWERYSESVEAEEVDYEDWLSKRDICETCENTGIVVCETCKDCKGKVIEFVSFDDWIANGDYCNSYFESWRENVESSYEERSYFDD